MGTLPKNFLNWNNFESHSAIWAEFLVIVGTPPKQPGFLAQLAFAQPQLAQLPLAFAQLVFAQLVFAQLTKKLNRLKKSDIKSTDWGGSKLFT